MFLRLTALILAIGIVGTATAAVVRPSAETLGTDPFVQLAEEGSEDDYKCVDTMLSKGGELVDAYAQIMSEFFQQDVPSSEQIEYAATFYRATENKLNRIYNQGLFIEGRKSFDQSNAEVAACSNVRDQLVEYAQQILEAQALLSNSSKNTFEVVDGLKVLNEGLEDLRLDFSAVFPVVFNKMDNALPCYARQCIVK